MLKIAKDVCTIDTGSIILPNKVSLYYVIKSPELTDILKNKSAEVTSIDMFQEFTATGPLTIPLTNPQNPMVSMVRLLLSPRPYDLGARLAFGEDSQTQYILYREPKIILSSNEEVEPLCDIQLYYKHGKFDETPQPFPKKVHKQRFPGVIPMVTFPPSLTVKTPSSTGTPWPIIKQPPVTAFDLTSENVAKIFAALKTPDIYLLETAREHRALNIMNRSHNNLNVFPESTDISPLQQMFLKHVFLARKGMENFVPMFFEVYYAFAPEESKQDIEIVENSLEQIEVFAENAVFCLSTIATIVKPTVKVTTSASVSYIRLANKYFSMFKPMNMEVAVIFGAAVLDQLCKGTPLQQIVAVLAKYAHVIRRPRAPSIRLYTILTL